MPCSASATNDGDFSSVIALTWEDGDFTTDVRIQANAPDVKEELMTKITYVDRRA